MGNSTNTEAAEQVPDPSDHNFRENGRSQQKTQKLIKKCRTAFRSRTVVSLAEIKSKNSARFDPDDFFLFNSMTQTTKNYYILTKNQAQRVDNSVQSFLTASQPRSKWPKIVIIVNKKNSKIAGFVDFSKPISVHSEPLEAYKWSSLGSCPTPYLNKIMISNNLSYFVKVNQSLIPVYDLDLRPVFGLLIAGSLPRFYHQPFGKFAKISISRKVVEDIGSEDTEFVIDEVKERWVRESVVFEPKIKKILKRKSDDRSETSDEVLGSGRGRGINKPPNKVISTQSSREIEIKNFGFFRFFLEKNIEGRGDWFEARHTLGNIVYSDDKMQEFFFNIKEKLVGSFEEMLVKVSSPCPQTLIWTLIEPFVKVKEVFESLQLFFNKITQKWNFVILTYKDLGAGKDGEPEVDYDAEYQFMYFLRVYEVENFGNLDKKPKFKFLDIVTQEVSNRLTKVQIRTYDGGKVLRVTSHGQFFEDKFYFFEKTKKQLQMFLELTKHKNVSLTHCRASSSTITPDGGPQTTKLTLNAVFEDSVEEVEFDVPG